MEEILVQEARALLVPRRESRGCRNSETRSIVPSQEATQFYPGIQNTGFVRQGPYQGQRYNVIATDEWSDEVFPRWIRVLLGGNVERELREKDLRTPVRRQS